jgi:hypothetical protein
VTLELVLEAKNKNKNYVKKKYCTKNVHTLFCIFVPINNSTLRMEGVQNIWATGSFGTNNDSSLGPVIGIDLGYLVIASVLLNELI